MRKILIIAMVMFTALTSCEKSNPVYTMKGNGFGLQVKVEQMPIRCMNSLMVIFTRLIVSPALVMTITGTL